MKLSREQAPTSNHSANCTADWNLDDAVLEEYIERFYGHGLFGAKYWFVGMEFGGGGTVAEIVGRIQGWHDRGGKELEDLADPEGIASGLRRFNPQGDCI